MFRTIDLDDPAERRPGDLEEGETVAAFVGELVAIYERDCWVAQTVVQYG